jgi:ribosomal protein L37E
MIYKDQCVLLASKHRKEQAIAPIFREQIGCNLCLEDIDTDQFGTFTGEIPRPLSAYETCILKAKHAANEKKYVLSIASEGSFGPHPSNPFIPHAHEIMVFVDLENDWVIAEQLVTPNTNYKMMTINQDTILDSFVSAVHFPSHALTFMRAMMNPTRMQTLAELAEKLAIRIMRSCPGCGIPGFGFKSVSGHLLCSLCGDETKMYQYEDWGCIRCDYEEKRSRKDQLIVAAPTNCDYCNP